MGFCEEKPAFARGAAAMVALVLVTLSRVSTESHIGVPCPCDDRNCAALTECWRLLAESTDGDVRYRACPGGKECCCQNSRTFHERGVNKNADFSDETSEGTSTSSYVDTTETSKTYNSRENIVESYINASDIKETNESLETNSSSGGNLSTSENINAATAEYNQIDETFTFGTVERTELPKVLNLSIKTDATEAHSSKASSEATGDLRIVGGSYDPLRNDNWTVHITTYDNAEKGAYQCTGSLISARHILTAAHCMYDRLGNRRRVIRLSFGLRGKNRNRPQFLLENDFTFIQHPNFVYAQSRLLNDIALIRTGSVVPTDDVIKAIKLLPETYTTSDLANTWVRVTGWGGMYPLAASELLLQTDMQIRDRGCSQNPAVFNPRSHLCLVGVNRSDICDGDSGAPLTIYLRGKVYLVGVISSGSVDCSGNRPAVAVFAGYHRAWIERTISEVERDYINYVQFA